MRSLLWIIYSSQKGGVGRNLHVCVIGHSSVLSSSLQVLDSAQVLTTVTTVNDKEKALRVPGTDRFDREEDVRYDIFSDPAIKPERWTNYVYSGRFKTTGPSDAVGFTVFSNGGNRPDQGYVVRVTANHPTFAIESRPYGLGVTQLTGTLDSGFKPTPGEWTQFKIEAQKVLGTTELRATFWPVGSLEPGVPQIVAVDTIKTRATGGTVGIWAVNVGPQVENTGATGAAKPAVLVTGVHVLPLPFTSLASTAAFSPSTSDDLGRWLDTGGINGDRNPTGDGGFFQKTPLQSGRISLAVDSLSQAQCTFDAPDVLIWSDYVVTGRMRVETNSQQLGIAFLSRCAAVSIQRNAFGRFFN